MLNYFLAGLVLSASLWAKGSFLTPKEHGEMVYREPRGVSCAKCHGKNAEGRVIANYTQKKEPKTLFAPPLGNLSTEALKAGIKNHNFGPPYHLSDEEYQNLETYLKR